MSLKKTLPKKNQEFGVIMSLLNNVLCFLFLCRDHLDFLELSFWFIKQLVCYWKAQNISSDCLPVSMIKELTSDFLFCGIQKLGGFIRVFFFLRVFLFLWKPIQIPLKVSGEPCSRPLGPVPLVSLTSVFPLFRIDSRFKAFNVEIYLQLKVTVFYSNNFVGVWPFWPTESFCSSTGF